MQQLLSKLHVHVHVHIKITNSIEKRYHFVINVLDCIYLEKIWTNWDLHQGSSDC